MSAVNVMSGYIYYAAVLIGHITGLAHLSICRFACLSLSYWVLYRKQKKMEKPELLQKIGVTGVPIFSSKGPGQG